MAKRRDYTAAGREFWLAQVERLATEKNPELRGRIDWDTAIYLCNQGESMAAAAEILSKIEPRKHGR